MNRNARHLAAAVLLGALTLTGCAGTQASPAASSSTMASPSMSKPMASPSMTESMPGLRRQQRDRERISPRATTAELGHPRMQRPLPSADQERTPFSSRQKKARSKTRVSVQGNLPAAQYQAQRALMTSPRRWAELNDALSDNAGDVQALTDTDPQPPTRSQWRS